MCVLLKRDSLEQKVDWKIYEFGESDEEGATKCHTDDILQKADFYIWRSRDSL